MEVIGRSHARSTLTSLGTSGPEHALLLVGELGSGKSHLLADAHAATPGSTVLVRIPPHEWRFGLAGIATLMASLAREPILDAVPAQDVTDPEELFALGLDLVARIRALDLEPTVALIDDLDRMDPASRAVLGTIAAHLAGTSLWLAATATDDVSDTVPGFEPVRLLPLTDDELVAAITLGRDADPSTVLILAGYAEGNPRVLTEQVDQLGDAATGPLPLALPPRATPTVEQLTEPVVAGLTPSQRQVLDRVALAPLTHLAALGDVVSDALDVVDDLIDARVLERRGPHVRIADQRVRSRIYWEQGSAARREHRARLADVCAVRDECLVPWYTGATIDHPHVDELLVAAVALVRGGWVSSAVEFAERALTRAERVEDHAGLLTDLSTHLLRAGHLMLADRYSVRAAAAGTTPEQSMDLFTLRLVAQLFTTRHLVDDELSALADLHACEHPEGAASMLCIGAAYRTERWETQEARRLIERALQVADDVSTTKRLELFAVRDIVDGIDGVATSTPLPGLDDSISADTDLLLLRSRALSVREDYSEARQLLAVVHNRPAGLGALTRDLASYGTIHNEIAATEFRLARAAADAWDDDSPSLLSETSSVALVHGWYAFSLARTDEARCAIERSIALASSEANPAVRARAMALRGTLHLLSGDPESAITDLRQVSAAASRFRNPLLLRHWADYVEVCVATGRTREAKATVAALDHALASHRSRWGELAVARCRALVEPGGPSLPLLEAAVKAFARDELPYELGRTLRCLATRQEELGMSVAAWRTGTAAVAAFESSGTDAWASCAEHRAPTRATPPAGGAERILARLSQDERDVAVRVAQGLHNREIAEELFVSVRTVELRLTHVYRTLGIGSRAQLMVMLASGGFTADTPPPGSPPPPPPA